MTKKEYERQFELIDGGVWAVCEHLKGELWNPQIVKILNEQQATINNQEQKIKILQQEISDTQAILQMLTEKLKGWNDE